MFQTKTRSHYRAVAVLEDEDGSALVVADDGEAGLLETAEWSKACRRSRQRR
jgi:hypothetical protein